MNDGGCDPDGRFLCGSMAYDERPGAGALYRLDPDGSVAVVLEGVTISNGLEWSPDGTRAYYVDTPTREISVFAYDSALCRAPRPAAVRRRRAAARRPHGRRRGRGLGRALRRPGDPWGSVPTARPRLASARPRGPRDRLYLRRRRPRPPLHHDVARRAVARGRSRPLGCCTSRTSACAGCRRASSPAEGDQSSRRARLAATRGGSSGCFGYTGGHGASSSPLARSRSCISSRGSRDCGAPSIAAHGSPLRPSRPGRSREGQLAGIDVVELLPRDRRRDLPTSGVGPHRPRAEDGLVPRVLVVVDEDPLAALLLPPGRGEDVGPATLELARHSDARGARRRRPSAAAA